MDCPAPCLSQVLILLESLLISDGLFCSRHLTGIKRYPCFFPVPDKRSRILEVVIVRRIFNLGTENLEGGGNGKGLRKGRSVYE
jgi:hypothetical protein